MQNKIDQDIKDIFGIRDIYFNSNERIFRHIKLSNLYWKEEPIDFFIKSNMKLLLMFMSPIDIEQINDLDVRDINYGPRDGTSICKSTVCISRRGTTNEILILEKYFHYDIVKLQRLSKAATRLHFWKIRKFGDKEKLKRIQHLKDSIAKSEAEIEKIRLDQERMKTKLEKLENNG